MKVRGSVFALVLFLFIPTACASAQNCLSYEPDKVVLLGTISKKTFPGPPNYESIRKGDRPETAWILHLDQPICTIAAADNDAESNVTDVQLMVSQKLFPLIRKFLGKKSVALSGQLSHAITGHHHTPVLLEVEMVGERGQRDYIPPPSSNLRE